MSLRRRPVSAAQSSSPAAAATARSSSEPRRASAACFRGKTSVRTRDTLAAIYSWFTEGFDTADIRDAKTLLDELSPAST